MNWTRIYIVAINLDCLQLDLISYSFLSENKIMKDPAIFSSFSWFSHFSSHHFSLVSELQLLQLLSLLFEFLIEVYRKTGNDVENETPSSIFCLIKIILFANLLPFRMIKFSQFLSRFSTVSRNNGC